MNRRWKKRPAGSNWGDFGEDDQIGRLNLLTEEKRMQAIAEVREGLSFCLSLPLDYPGGNTLNENRYPPILRPCLRHGGVNMNYAFRQQNPNSVDLLSDDLAILHTQYSSHWDGLCHVGALFDVNDDGKPVPVYYNGFRAGEDILGPDNVEDCGLEGPISMASTSHANSLGIENMAATCVQGRAVMIDLHRHFGNEHVSVDHDRLMDIMAKDGIEIGRGDILCLHTGLADLILRMNKKPDRDRIMRSCAVLNGSDEKLREWIFQSGICAIAADNYAVEDFPVEVVDEGCSILPLHHLCLFKLGIHLGELWHLTPLAEWLRRNHRSRFMLTAPPLRLPGAVGSPVTPIATV